ncbi:MAG: MarR family winged helix-turn-helix transcriptional regulator [Pyrinomonadaceae bacterium]
MSRKGNDLKSRADRVARGCYSVHLRVFNRLISRIYNDSLSSGGLTVSQFNILTAVVKCEPVAPGQVSSVLHLEKSTLSRNIELMRKNGWITTETKDRTLLISTTGKGRDLYKNSLPLWEQAQRKARKLAGEEIFQQIDSTVSSLLKK